MQAPGERGRNCVPELPRKQGFAAVPGGAAASAGAGVSTGVARGLAEPAAAADGRERRAAEGVAAASARPHPQAFISMPTDPILVCMDGEDAQAAGVGAAAADARGPDEGWLGCPEGLAAPRGMLSAEEEAEWRARREEVARQAGEARRERRRRRAEAEVAQRAQARLQPSPDPAVLIGARAEGF